MWLIASAARLRRSRGHRTERGQPVFSSRRHCGCPLGQDGVRSVPACSRPGRERCPRRPPPRVPVTALAHHTHWPAARPLHVTSSGQWPAHLRQSFADSDAGPGSRISRPPPPEVMLRHVPFPSPPFSHLHDHVRLTRAAPPPRPVPVIPCGRCKQPTTPLNPCTVFTDYLCATDRQSPCWFVP